MFNREYYQQKKQEIETKIAGKKDEVIQEITNVLNRFYADLADLQERYQEVIEKLKEEEENNEGESRENS